MNNITNWLLAIIIVLLLSGGIYWISTNDGNQTTNANSDVNTTTTDDSGSQTTAVLTEAVTDRDWTIGPKDAKVQLVEYADYQCPACRQLSPTFESVAKKYPDQVSFTYRHYPLSYHELAKPSAQIAEAAGAQGKYWEMHDYLYSGELNLENAYTKAGELGLDVEKMKQEIADGKYTAKVDGDFASGSAAGVPGTPSLFMNGKMLEWEDTINLEATIKKELGL